MKRIRFIKNRKSGFVSIETVFAMSFFLIFFFLVIGFFTYVYPYSVLQREVHALATLAQKQGGLTLEDVQNFEDRVVQYRFVDISKEDIEVTAVAIPSNMEAIGIDSLDEAGNNYIKRDSKEFIQLTVTIPSYNEVLTPIARFFGVNNVMERYTFRETFMSERY